MDLSFVIPFYKGENFIQYSVESIKKAYENSSQKLEIELVVIIDSENSDFEFVSQKVNSIINHSFSCLIVKNSNNIGVAATRNNGVKICKGNFIICLDQDDEIAEDFFHYVNKDLLNKNDFVLLNGLLYFEATNQKLFVYYKKPTLTLRSLSLFDIIRSPGQVVVKKEYLLANPFPVPQNYFGADDKFCWINLFAKQAPQKIKYLNQPLYIGKIHDQNFSGDYRQLYLSQIELWQQMISSNKNNKELIDLYNRNLLYCNYKLGKIDSLVDKIKGVYFNVCYLLRVNKLLPFLIKKTNRIIR